MLNLPCAPCGPKQEARTGFSVDTDSFAINTTFHDGINAKCCARSNCLVCLGVLLNHIFRGILELGSDLNWRVMPKRLTIGKIFLCSLLFASHYYPQILFTSAWLSKYFGYSF